MVRIQPHQATVKAWREDNPYRVSRRADTRIAKIDEHLSAHLDLSLRQQTVDITNFEMEMSFRIGDLMEEVRAYAEYIRSIKENLAASSQSEATDEGLKCPETLRTPP